MSPTYIFSLILQERQRQEHLLKQGKFPFTCANPEISDIQKLPVLGEEFGEVSKAINEQQSIEELKSELIQVAAVCVAWLESLP